MVDEQKNRLERMRSDVEKVVKDFRALPVVKQQEEVLYFKGKEGIKTVYEDVLSIEEDYIGYGPGMQIDNLLKAYFKDYAHRRAKKKIHLKMIWDERSRGMYFTKTPLLESRFLPDDLCSHAALRIYGNKVAIILYSDEQPIAVMIENKAIADGYRRYFEVMWKAAKP